MRLNHPDLVKVCIVGPPRTHLKVLYTPCFLFHEEVRGGSMGLNHPDLVYMYRTHPVPPVKMLLEKMRYRLNHPDLVYKYPTHPVPPGS